MEEDKTTRQRQACEEKEHTGRENIGDKTGGEGREKTEDRGRQTSNRRGWDDK